jgi:dihydroflavonol-4-reductase
MILVTGGTGHLGNVLVRELEEIGNPVRVLVLPGEDTTALEGTRVEIVSGNILDTSSLDRAMDGVDTVFHMAALVSIEPGREDLLYKINVEGTKNVLTAAIKAGVNKLIYTSSIHALARPPLGVQIDETQPFDIDNEAGPYDRTKALASVEVAKSSNSKFTTVIVCPTGVIGPYDFRRSEMGEQIIEWMNKKISFLVKGMFDWVDVRDVAKGHILASQNGKPGQTYILGGHQVSLTGIRSMVAKLVNNQSLAITIPLPIAIWSTYLTDLYYKTNKKRPRFTRYSLETVNSNSQICIARAQQELGYQPRSFMTTLQDTVAWWLGNQNRIKAGLRA